MPLASSHVTTKPPSLSADAWGFVWLPTIGELIWNSPPKGTPLALKRWP